MEAAYSSETLVDYQRTKWRYIPEYGTFQPEVMYKCMLYQCRTYCNASVSLATWDRIYTNHVIVFVTMTPCPLETVCFVEQGN
jgi:hypothetical protein